MNSVSNQRFTQTHVLICSLILMLSIIGFGCGNGNTGPPGENADPSGSADRTKIEKEDDSASPNGGPGSSDDPVSSGTDNSGNKIESVYTDIEREKCRTTEDEQKKLSLVYQCEGVAGYKLEVDEYDGRQTIHIIYPDGKKHNLKLDSVVSPAFSYVGKKAEWRVVKEGGQTKPIALIVRFIVSRGDIDPENPPPDMSYLTVSKITENSACVTDAVKPVKNQNSEARKLADSSAGKPCLKPGWWRKESD